MKRDIKLYGTSILPAFFLTSIFPLFSIVPISICFGASALALCIISKMKYGRFDKTFYKRNILRVWLFGYGANFAGALYLFFNGIAAEDFVFQYHISKGVVFSIYQAAIGYTYYDNLSFAFILSGVALAALTSFIIHFFFTLSIPEVKTSHRFLLSLMLTVLTAPYGFLIPSEILCA